MEATFFVSRGYMRLHPSATIYSPMKRPRPSYVALRSSVRTNAYYSDPEKRWEQFMKTGLELITLSPMDTEYPEDVKDLLPIFSKCGFFFYRLIVQVKWLLKLSEIPEVKEVPRLSSDACAFLENIILEFCECGIHEGERLEHATNPDVRAVLNFLKEKCKGQHEISKVLQNYQVTCTREMFLTAYVMLVKDAINRVMFPLITDLCKTLSTLAGDNEDESILSHTHDHTHPPEPTLEKELALFANKFRKHELTSLADQLSKVAKCASKFPILTYFTGEGNYIADKYHEINWPHVAEEFVTLLGLKLGPDEQICMENSTELFFFMVRINKILDDLDPIVIKGGIIESNLSLLKMFQAIKERTFKMAVENPPPDLQGGWVLVPYTDPFRDDMALVIGYSTVRCKIILQELKKLL